MCNFSDYWAFQRLFVGQNEWAILFTLLLLGYIVAREIIPVIIRKQLNASVGQQVYESGPSAHLAKQGTPTMGGLAFPLAAAAAALYIGVSGNGGGNVAWIVTGLVALVAAIGFVDDYLSITRRTSLGLRARTKLLLLVVVAVVAARVLLDLDFGTECASSWGMGQFQWWFGRLIILPSVWYYALTIAAVVGCANAVNLTDGVDGLAGSVALPPLIVLSSLDGGIGWAVTGALVVFLYFNRHPAKVFMGDTGSLTLGALLTFLAIKLHLLLYLPLLGIVFVVEALSVIVQVASFKLTGKRIFKMSPLHHHFELSGWSEQRITRTFALTSWLASAVFCYIIYYSALRVPPH